MAKVFVRPYSRSACDLQRDTTMFAGAKDFKALVFIFLGAIAEGVGLVRPKRGKGMKIMAIVDRYEPLSVHRALEFIWVNPWLVLQGVFPQA